MTKLHALSALRAALFAAVLLPAGIARAQDLNVNGSLCVGFDCPPPSFGFDTIVLRENNLRIFFDDTSVSAGFPANKWRITINDSASGGASFFAIDDVTGSRTGVFKIMAGAPSASLFVASSGNVGIGTTVPGLDLSVFSGDTPAIRLEQSGSSGFTAQTFDIGANEANFFVRDLTFGGRLPFRIRPGAPTSSIDISGSGKVGVGTNSPNAQLSVTGADDNTFGQLLVTSSGNDARLEFRNANGATPTGRGSILMSRTVGFEGLRFMINNVDRAIIDENGNVGIGTTAPAAQLHTTGSVTFAGITGCSGGLQTGGSGQVSCLVSSRQFKNIAGDLAANVALANIMALRPQTGTYKDTPDVPEHWLIAEDVAEVDPALAGLRDGKPYVVKTQNVVADLVAVVQQQQRQIEELRRLIAARQ
ncbi:MAG: tail fiber domain-containing protein [Alphaproteobacteria bacterium]|nr:MAG: tail fiber domain-containing protein [Alphaproteobacteria bacterium]